MCARAARQPWRSRDTASLTAAKNQKSRTGENGGTSARPVRVPKKRVPSQGAAHGRRVLDGILAPNRRKRESLCDKSTKRWFGAGRPRRRHAAFPALLRRATSVE